MIYRSFRIVSYIVSALLIVSADSVVAQTPATLQFVPGELLIGFGSAKQRDAFVRKLERDQHHHWLRVGSEKIKALTIKKSGNSGLTLEIEFSDSVKDRARSDPNVGVKLLEKFAQSSELIRASHTDISTGSNK